MNSKEILAIFAFKLVLSFVPRFMRKVPFYLQILIALVAGILCGSFLPGGAKWIAWLGKLFMNALCMLIVPVIFFSISTSVQGICDKGRTGRSATKPSKKA